MVYVRGVDFIEAGVGQGDDGEIIVYGCVFAVANNYGGADSFFLELDRGTNTSRRHEYRVVSQKEFDAARELPRIKLHRTATQHEGWPTTDELCAFAFVWLMSLPDGRCIGILEADQFGHGDDMTIKGQGVA